MNGQTNEPLIELEEVRQRLGFENIDTVRRMCRRGEIKSFKFGRTYKTTWTWVNDFLAEKYVQSGERTQP